ncbi:hypothetical protein [Candidatus Viridilinea mediisalina]|uniref:Uncharacterized protein n=1 Tax=Candidatus Viridilinea mediisalina TaxID=2024553 RepID=A0A2A6RF52_9CHLR|nr:hypothetical protein [Candidatus Viridilinea mediisalina]PDW01509.1 hypothetical protein CJ255_18750 [Candidatus Viridilinea mediisalina]
MLTYATGKAARQLGSLGLRYTERQLYYETCRLLLPWWRYLPFNLAVPVAWPRFAAALAELQAHGADLAGLLPPTVAHVSSATTLPPDLQLFGLPRVLLCSDASIVAMLDANGLLLEAGCPVLSVAQASPLPPMLGQMLQQGGGRVYLLHHANVSDMKLAAELGPRLHLPEGTRYTALGLRPTHALRLRLFVLREGETDEAALGVNVTPKDRHWLAGGRSAELAAMHPLRFMRGLRRLLYAEAPTPNRWTQLRRWPHLGHMSWP